MERTKTADELFEIAGLAAELLEKKGFVSVARMRDGIVTLEWWKIEGSKQVHMRKVINEVNTTPEEIAYGCIAEFHGSVSTGGPSS